MKVKSIYLNDQLKDYYHECLLKEISDGRIDSGIEGHLLLLSKSKNVRPMFSKKGFDDFINFQWSILTISFTLKVENKILSKIVPFLNEKYNNYGYSEFNYYEIEPKVAAGRIITETNKGANWLVDPEYSNINQVRFDLKNGSADLHNQFWNEITRLLFDS